MYTYIPNIGMNKKNQATIMFAIPVRVYNELY